MAYFKDTKTAAKKDFKTFITDYKKGDIPLTVPKFIKDYKAGNVPLTIPKYIKDNPKLNKKLQNYLKSLNTKQYGGSVRKAKY